MNIKYGQFWNWFFQNKALFEETKITDQSIELIDQKIRELGDFAWEIGPGDIKLLSLTISPGGDRALLSTTRKIISHAPILDDWEFHYAKPVKNWDNYFEVVVNGKEVGIDISRWEYILFRYKDSIYDIQIKPDSIPEVIRAEKEEVLYGIVEMVLESIIGEERRLEIINDLEVVSRFELDFENDGSSIVNLKKHLDSINE
jgi:hypothetical protein